MVKVNRLQEDVKDLTRKSDKLLYMIIAAVVFKGGLDLFRDQRNFHRTHPEPEK